MRTNACIDGFNLYYRALENALPVERGSGIAKGGEGSRSRGAYHRQLTG